MSARAKSPEEFARKLAQAAPGIELLDTYVNARTKLACRCRVCGHEWDAVLNHLLHGRAARNVQARRMLPPTRSRRGRRLPRPTWSFSAIM